MCAVDWGGRGVVTAWDVLLAGRRRWRVVVTGMFITCLAALYLGRLPGVYWSQVNVVFQQPLTPQTPNSLQFQSESLIDLAGLVGRRAAGPGTGSGPVSDSVTLVGLGVTDGYSVSLPNSGGQWAYNFDKPVLDVQAVGPTAADVSSKLQRAVGQIQTELAAEQQRFGVSPANTVKTRLNPQDPAVHYDKGSRSRTLLATLLLGLGATGTAVIFLDRRSVMQRAAPSPRHVAAERS